jgi:hypothetical protein
MNRKRGLYTGLAIFLTILIVLVLVAKKSHVENPHSESTLSVNQAVNILAKEGINLHRTWDFNAEEIHGVKPATFYINDTNHKLNIYCYNSINERKIASEMWLNSDGFKLYSSEPNTCAKNLMLLIIPADEKELKMQTLEQLNIVVNTVFEKLNDTQEIIFTGTGNNWESNTVVKFHEYLYHDEQATLNNDNYYNVSTSLKYLGEDIESVDTLSYQMQAPAYSQSGTIGRSFYKNDMVMLGSSSGKEKLLSPEDDITFTIKWNGQEETFVASSET